MEWHKLKVTDIIGGYTADNVRLLTLFLKEYSLLFNETNLCVTCNNLIAEYHKKYIIKIMEKSNTCEYKLHEKYNNIPLGFGSSVYVNNGNITNEYAEILLKNRGASLFASVPTTKEVEKITIVEPANEPRTKGTRKKKR